MCQYPYNMQDNALLEMNFTNRCDVEPGGGWQTTKTAALETSRRDFFIDASLGVNTLRLVGKIRFDVRLRGCAILSIIR